MSENRFFYVSPAGKLVRMDSLPETLATLKQDGFIWLDYRQPTKEDLEILIEPLGLHPLSIEDSLDNSEIPKIEDYPKHSFILFNAFRYIDNEISIHEVDFFIGERYLVTVSGIDAHNQPILNGIDRIFEHDLENSQKGPAFLAHIILDWIVDQKFYAIELLEEQLDNAENTILENHASFAPSDLLHLRRTLLLLRKSLFHEREILMKISRKDCLFIPESAIIFYRDIYDHLAKFFELTESYRDIVTSLMEMYLTMLNNQMTNTANQTNITVRRLTFITTIFMPLSLLAGIGGMSEWSMMTGPENWRIAYPLFLLAMVIIGVANFYLLKWIDRKSKDKD